MNKGQDRALKIFGIEKQDAVAGKAEHTIDDYVAKV